MNWDVVLTHLKDGENASSRFFGSVHDYDEIGPTLVAMANTKGGNIFVGMDAKNCHLFGTELTRDWVMKLITTYCTPQVPIRMDFIEKNDHQILLIDVPDCTDKPYYYKQTCYVMDGALPKMSLLDRSNSARTFESELKEPLKDAPSPLPIEQPPVPAPEPEPAYRAPINPENLNLRQNQTLDFLQKQQNIQNKTYRKLFNVSHKTAHIELVDMVAKGYIRSQGSGRSTMYVLRG